MNTDLLFTSSFMYLSNLDNAMQEVLKSSQTNLKGYFLDIKKFEKHYGADA